MALCSLHFADVTLRNRSLAHPKPQPTTKQHTYETKSSPS